MATDRACLGDIFGTYILESIFNSDRAVVIFASSCKELQSRDIAAFSRCAGVPGATPASRVRDVALFFASTCKELPRKSPDVGGRKWATSPIAEWTQVYKSHIFGKRK